MGLELGLLKKNIPVDDIIDRDFIPQTIVPAAIDVKKIPVKEKD